MTIEYDIDGDSFINMSTGGMLALFGDADADYGNNDGDITLDEFYDMIEGTDAINYWDGSDWVSLTGATEGVDYWLNYYDSGDLAGYTVLTVVAIPEPVSLLLILVGMLGSVRKKR